MPEFIEINGVNLDLSDSHDFSSDWIGQLLILKQILACWMVVGIMANVEI